ncbi:hypothetical protein BDK92_7168 [Micromonospora pisi]|uniref:Uncharacterized protein n=1 Tax=Micromonospora pisi TaxID=589240 RepID=A0A495JUM1_9ACTN|nr:hypothetical protein [Micromonospora pisi]RKR92690.1 hypothetical protein BDK92_7168 [Micromonospora pisi]
MNTVIVTPADRRTNRIDARSNRRRRIQPTNDRHANLRPQPLNRPARRNTAAAAIAESLNGVTV